MATPQSQHISLCNHKSTVSGSQKRPSTRLPVTSKEPGESLPGTQPRPETQYSGKSRHGDIGRNVERDGASQNERNAHPSYGTTYSRAHTPRTPVSQTLHPDGTMLTPSPAPPSHPQYVAGPSPAAKTPSLFSGSTVSAYESPRSALRRKPSTIDQYAFRAKTDPDSIQEHQELVEIAHDTISDPFPGSIFGIAFPPTGANRQDGKRAPKSKRGSTTVVEPQPVRTLVSPQPSTTNTTTKSHPRGHEGGTIQQSKSRVPSQTAESVASRLPTRNAPTSKETLSSRSQKDIRSKPRGTDLLFNDVSISQKAETVPTVSAAYQTERPPQTATAQVIDHASRRTGLPSSPAAYRDLGLPKSRSKDATTATQIASNSARPVQIPPEFAHLNVDVPPVKPSADTTAPRRPSRDGTPSLMEYQGPSPIVHSNLPPIYTSYHKRTPSLETPVSVTSPASSSSRRLFGFSPRSSSRDASPRVDFAISPPPSARLFSCGGTGSAKDAQPPVDRKGSPMIGPGPSPSKSPRFGFLHRKPKEEQKRLEKPRREPRRGPAAGTGHEGYGRFGFRGRSGTSASGSSPGRSPSADSLASSNAPPSTTSSAVTQTESDIDDFLRERLSPVILRGQGSSSTMSATASKRESSDAKPSIATTSPTSSSIYSTDSPDPAAFTRGLNIGASSHDRPVKGFRRLSGGSGDDPAEHPADMAVRRSMRLSKVLGIPGSPSTPAPISIAVDRIGPAGRHGADPAANVPRQRRTGPTMFTSEEGREGHWLKTSRSNIPARSSGRLNFFQRAAKGQDRPVINPNALPAAVPEPQHQTARYALMDTVESVALEDIETMVLGDSHMSPKSHKSHGGNSTAHPLVPYEQRHLALLPSPPALEETKPRRRSPPILMLRTDSAESPELLRAQTAMAMPAKSPQLVDIPRSQPPTPQTSQPLSPHVPRLSPIGRIPRVISRRDRERKLPDQSFSRPFAKSQPRPAVKPPGSFYAEIRHLASPPGSQPTSSTTGPSELASAGPKDNTPTDPSSVSAFDAYMSKTPVDEFIAFSPRKNSELSYTSSSGIASVSSKHTYQYHLTGAHGEEDVWHEYNDLLDEVLPEKTPLSTGSSLGQPFQYADIESDIERRVPINKPLPSLPLKYDINLGGLNTKRANLADVHDSRPPAAYAQPIDIPGTPFSISEYVAGYGDRTSGMAGSSSRLSMPWAHRSSMQPVRANHPPSRRSHASTHSRSMSLPETPFQQPHSPSADDVRNPQMLSSVAGETADKSVEAALLKRDALMTSKWLSFGRVLFSPAQDEAESGSDAKILVVDGLGKGKQSVYNLLDYAN